jgi:hypothetical protein
LKITGLRSEIIVKLDIKRERAIAKLVSDKREFEYRAKEYASDYIDISTIESYEELAAREFKKNLIEMLVYNLISRWANSYNTEENSQDLKTFSDDKQFIQLIDNIYKIFKNGHTKFMEAVKSYYRIQR